MLFKPRTFAGTWQTVQCKLELLHQKGKIQGHPGIKGKGQQRRVRPLTLQRMLLSLKHRSENEQWCYQRQIDRQRGWGGGGGEKERERRKSHNIFSKFAIPCWPESLSVFGFMRPVVRHICNGFRRLRMVRFLIQGHMSIPVPSTVSGKMRHLCSRVWPEFFLWHEKKQKSDGVTETGLSKSIDPLFKFTILLELKLFLVCSLLEPYKIHQTCKFSFSTIFTQKQLHCFNGFIWVVALCLRDHCISNSFVYVFKETTSFPTI